MPECCHSNERGRPHPSYRVPSSAGEHSSPLRRTTYRSRVIARSEATWQSVPLPSPRGEGAQCAHWADEVSPSDRTKPRPVLHRATSSPLRGASPQGEAFGASPTAQVVPFFVSLRGAKRRGNPHPRPCLPCVRGGGGAGGVAGQSPTASRSPLYTRGPREARIEHSSPLRRSLAPFPVSLRDQCAHRLWQSVPRGG